MANTNVTTVLTSAMWNAILDKVNGMICSGSNFKHVVDPHVWSLKDVQAVQNVLTGTCSTNKFTTPVGPPYLWKQKIIDEINAAVAAGCCNTNNNGNNNCCNWNFTVMLWIYVIPPGGVVAPFWNNVYFTQGNSYPLFAATTNIANLSASMMSQAGIKYPGQPAKVTVAGPTCTATSPKC